MAIVQEQGPGLKTQLFCSSLEVLHLYNVPSKATVSLVKEEGAGVCVGRGYNVAGQARKQSLILCSGTRS